MNVLHVHDAITSRACRGRRFQTKRLHRYYSVVDIQKDLPVGVLPTTVARATHPILSCLCVLLLLQDVLGLLLVLLLMVVLLDSVDRIKVYHSGRRLHMLAAF